MSELVGDRPPADVPQSKAQDLVYEALEAEGPHRVRLANKALKLDPLCADALVLLAENANSLSAAAELYVQALQAAERRLGKRAFREYAGEFWGFLETRPYMRARAGLAGCLWRLGRREEAVEHYQEMLELNPGDNQGIRYRLINHLLELGRTSDANALLRSYPDDGGAEWFYSAALLEFRRTGDGEESRRLLALARRANKHVPALLLGERQLPQFLPQYIQPGQADEAVCYVSAALAVWRSIPGAITWLRTQVAQKARKARPTRTKKSSAAEESHAKRLPQDPNEIWQLGLADIDDSSATGGEGGRTACIALVIDRTAEEQVTMDMKSHRPADDELWELLLKGLCSPEKGAPRRPGIIHVRDETAYQQLLPRLARIGVACELVAELDMVDFFLSRMQSRLGDGSIAQDSEVSEQELAQLPQEPEVWQADVRRMPIWSQEEGRPERPWLVLLTAVEPDLVLSTRLQNQPPSSDALWQVLAAAMQSSELGPPHRPRRIVFRSAPLYEALRPRLEAIGIAGAMADCLEHWERVFTSLIEDGPFTDEIRQALFAGEGVTRDQVGDIFAAAADFYRQAPWQRTPSDEMIQVTCPQLLPHPWFAGVIGQQGVATGLALYFDWKYVQHILHGREPTRPAMRDIDGLSLMFEEQYQLAAAEVNAAEEEGWPVATPEAWPMVIRVLPKLKTRPPSSGELAILEATLKGVAEFVARHGPFPAPAEAQVVSVTTAAGQMDLRLEWVKSK